jgi:hypothetical protein
MAPPGICVFCIDRGAPCVQATDIHENDLPEEGEHRRVF